MANPLLGEILSSVLGGGRRSSGGLGGITGLPGGAGGGLPGGVPGGMGGGGGLGSVLGGMLGGGRGAGGLGGNRNLLVAMLLPLAMQWVQRNGGVGAVLDRFRQRGYGPQANSWVGTGANHAIDASAIEDVVGRDDISNLAQQLGVPEDEVANGLGEVLPEMVDHLSPEGEIPSDADTRVDEGLTQLQDVFAKATSGMR